MEYTLLGTSFFGDPSTLRILRQPRMQRVNQEGARGHRIFVEEAGGGEGRGGGRGAFMRVWRMSFLSLLTMNSGFGGGGKGGGVEVTIRFYRINVISKALVDNEFTF